MLSIHHIWREFQSRFALTKPDLGAVRIILLLIWAISSFGICFFARDIERGKTGFGLIYGFAGQGLLIVFIVLVVVNAVVFNRRAARDGEEPVTDEAGTGV